MAPYPFLHTERDFLNMEADGEDMELLEQRVVDEIGWCQELQLEVGFKGFPRLLGYGWASRDSPTFVTAWECPGLCLDAWLRY